MGGKYFLILIAISVQLFILSKLSMGPIHKFSIILLSLLSLLFLIGIANKRKWGYAGFMIIFSFGLVNTLLMLKTISERLILFLLFLNLIGYFIALRAKVGKEKKKHHRRNNNITRDSNNNPHQTQDKSILIEKELEGISSNIPSPEIVNIKKNKKNSLKK